MANKKILLSFGTIIIVLVAAVTVFVVLRSQQPTTENTGPENQTNSASLPAATGNIDDAVQAILGSVTEDETALADEESDSSYINYDAREFNSFGQSYDGTGL